MYESLVGVDETCIDKRTNEHMCRVVVYENLVGVVETCITSSLTISAANTQGK